MASEGDLLDINVWLALAVEDHPHHATASRYWREEAADRLAFCTVTALGFLRLATHGTVMRGRPLGAAEAWQAYRDFLRQPGVIHAAEPAGWSGLLEEWIDAGTLTPRLWTDAYLAAFARAGGMRFVSLDGDFARFDGLDFLHLQEVRSADGERGTT